MSFKQRNANIELNKELFYKIYVKNLHKELYTTTSYHKELSCQVNTLLQVSFSEKYIKKYRIRNKAYL